MMWISAQYGTINMSLDILDLLVKAVNREEHSTSVKDE